MVKELKSANFKSEVLEEKGIVLVDVYATWCGPCKMLSPIVDAISEEEKDLKVAKIDIDTNTEIAEDYSVMSIPTLLLFKDGVLKEKSVGYQTKEQILSMLHKIR